MAATLGADLIMYGPIENCEGAMTAIAFTDIVLAEAAKELGVNVATDDHPLFKLV
jgi:tetrahydromethanopterin S-methyltransferase subunit H